MQELDRLQMKSQLEGAGLGLPLQGGAQGHNPGNRQPRREDDFCEGAEGKHTYSGTEREGRMQTPAQVSHVAGSLKTEARLCLETFPGASSEACHRWCSDMDWSRRQGLGHRGAQSTGGAWTQSGTGRGETEAQMSQLVHEIQRSYCQDLLEPVTTSCFLQGGTEINRLLSGPMWGLVSSEGM